MKKRQRMLPTRRSIRIMNKQMHSTPKPRRAGSKCSNMLPTRRSERIRKMKMCLCAEIGKKGSLIPGRQGVRIRKRKINSAPKREESKQRLPNELTLEILKFLSVKCLSRFKCVCKSWRAAIEERYFIMEHYSKAKCAHIFDRQGGNVRMGEETFIALYSIDGLVLESSNAFHKYRIRNPATKQILDLPHPHETFLSMKLMYLPNCKKYKLAYFYKKFGKKIGGCKVLTLESALQWRTLDIPCLRNLDDEKLGTNSTITVNSTLFVFMRTNSETVCIDMESESFSNVKIPQLQDFFSGSENVQLLRWNGMLSVCKLENKDGGWKLIAWVLEDFKKQRWAEKLIVIPLTFMKRYPNTMERDIFLQSVDLNWLGVIVSKEHRVVYHIESKSMTVNSAPPGHGYSIHYSPSLVRLDGMKEEEQ